MESNARRILIATGTLLGSAGLVGLLVVATQSNAPSTPAPTPCTTWKYPRFVDLPGDVVARSTELQHDMTKTLGYQSIEVWHGVLYRFTVLMHPPNTIVNRWHRGAEVEVCA